MRPESERGEEFRISVVDLEQIEALFSLAQSLPRKRVTLTLHRNPSEVAERMINVIMPESYIRPHNTSTHLIQKPFLHRWDLPNW